DHAEAGEDEQQPGHEPGLQERAVPGRRLAQALLAHALARRLLLLFGGRPAARPAAGLDDARGVAAMLAPALALGLGHGVWRVEDPQPSSGAPCSGISAGKGSNAERGAGAISSAPTTVACRRTAAT